MNQYSPRFLFWWRWLVAVTGAVVLFGAMLVFAPGLTRRFFGLLNYGPASALDDFGSSAVAYTSLMHGVLGAVMVGWWSRVYEAKTAAHTNPF